MHIWSVYYIYILHSSGAGKYYCGYSNDPWRRIIEHNTSSFNTYISKHRPWVLKAVFECSTLETEAIKIEKFIKRQKSHVLLERLIDIGFIPTGLLALLVRVPHVRD